ncbi:hypothetical protein ACPXCP_39920 [Streptomyces sp. DT20]|uniref:hypothetical protein n=1 Tax=Streptomyces sp. DT20 TaxID=3416519 RepID=UPI003CFAE59D
MSTHTTTTEIAVTTPGRGLIAYDLCDEVMNTYGLGRRDAHEAITALLQDLTNDDSGLILDKRPVRPELLRDNPGCIDVDYWVTVSEETTDHIRSALAAVHGDTN